MQKYLDEFISLMRKENLNEVVIQSFTNSYYKILEGQTGKLSEDEIQPVTEENLIDHSSLQNDENEALDKLVMIKLNGGLGTSMGLKKAKTLLKIKNELNFLDVIARQILSLRKRTNKNIPLLLMHSFNTRDESLAELAKYPNLKLPGLPLDFLQNKFPKIKQKDLSPLHNDNDDLNWNPPGHGEIYQVLALSGVLNKLLDKGYEYAFISNSDNLGAVIDNRILNYLIKQHIPFAMEVCRRTAMDKKGGHLAQNRKGQLLLRESAQCPETDIAEFQNIDKYRYFNTNNLWINLKALKQRLYETRYHLPLTMILNSKEVDGEKVFQVETAMGAAISVFNDAKAIIVKRNRFTPVKKTNDLLAVWSDCFELTDDHQLKLVNHYGSSPHIELEQKYYKDIDDFYERFQKGIPSLRNCRQLKINADAYFGKNVKVIGDVEIRKDGVLHDIVLNDETW